MKRLSRVTIAGLLLVCLPQILSAQDIRIGFVDPVRLLELSPQGEKALRLLEQEFERKDPGYGTRP